MSKLNEEIKQDDFLEEIKDIIEDNGDILKDIGEEDFFIDDDFNKIDDIYTIEAYTFLYPPIVS